MYALFDRVLKAVFTVELRMLAYGFDEQRVLRKRFTCMQDSTSLIIIDIRHTDNEFEARFFGRRYKSVGQTGRCGVSPQEGAARNGVRARGRLSPLNPEKILLDK